MLIGVDTHRDRHAAAVLDRNGGLVAQLEIDCDQAGLETLLRFVTDRAPGRRCWALEGSGCRGAGLASLLLAQVSGWSRSTGPSGPAAARANDEGLAAHPTCRLRPCGRRGHRVHPASIRIY
jgi:hypothetical protein